MAAETPQIETLAARSARSFWSMPRSPARSQVDRKTQVIRIAD